MAGKKKKSSSSKKNKSRGNNKNPIQLDEVLRQAESAMEMSEVDTALQLFGYAAGVLRSRVTASGADAPSTATSTTANTETSKADTCDDKNVLSGVLGKMGELKASNRDVDGARSDFLEAIELLGPSAGGDAKMAAAPGVGCDVNAAQNCESRAGLHLYLGQLSCGVEALSSFRVGVSELEAAVSILERIVDAIGSPGDVNMEGNDNEDGGGNMEGFLAETRRQLCAAHCSIAELYLTDLCEEPDAESACEAALLEALAVDEKIGGDTKSIVGPPLPEALQTMANFRLSQSRVSDAVECILKAYDRIRVGCEAMSALVGLADANGKTEGGVEVEPKARELVDVEAASSLPEYNFRCQTAKIMLECASLLENNDAGTKDTVNQCAESAIQVCGSLLAENDEVIEVWYLLGCAFMASTPPNQDSAHYYWENALTMLTKMKKGLEQSIDEDDENENELEVVECQILDIKTKLGKHGDEDEEMENS